MYEYVGHVVRKGLREPSFLPALALSHRDKCWCLQHEEIIGAQGHTGRVSPWTYERQFHEYFSELGLDWKYEASSKDRWLCHKNGWISHARGKN